MGKVNVRKKAEIQQEKQRNADVEKRNRVMNEFIERQAADYVLSEDASEDDRAYWINIFEPYEVGKDYAAGDKFRLDNTVYEVIQAHTSQSDWQPASVPALYKEVVQTKTVDPETGEETEVIPDFEQPTSTTAYSKGDKVKFNGEIYESTMDGNVWSPSSYPQGWKQIESE